MMKYVVGCLKGVEDIVKEELGVNSKEIIPGRLEFETKKAKELRSVYVIYKLIDHFDFISLENIIRKVSSLDFSFITKDFVVRCGREGGHDFNSLDVERKVGEVIFEKGHKVNLKSKTVVYVDILDNHCFVGILVGKKLNKRKYRLRRHNQGIDACLAYSVVKMGKASSIFDPFCKDGVILIEAGLSGIKELYGVDNKNNMRIAKINSSLAKVPIVFSKPKKVDCIITGPGRVSKNRLISFFKEAPKIAKNMIIVDCEDWIKRSGFELISEKEVFDKKNVKICSFRL